MKTLPGLRSLASLAASLGLLITLAPPAHAGATARVAVYTVRPDGSGDYVDLQTAIDAVPAGSTLDVTGLWVDYLVTISKSIRIVGMDLTTTKGYFGNGTYEILAIAAGPGDEVVLSDCSIVQSDAWVAFGIPGIGVYSAGRVFVEDCFIESAGIAYIDGCSYNSGDGIIVYDADSLYVTRSTILGGQGTHNGIDSCMGCCCVSGVRGGHGIVVYEFSGRLDRLIVVDSTIQGGAGGDIQFDCIDGCDWNPGDAFVAGDGGDGIRNPQGTTYVSNSAIAGAARGVRIINGCDSDFGFDGADGQASVGPLVDLGNRLSVIGTQLGGAVLISGTGFRARGVAFLLVGSGPLGPLTTNKLGDWFLDFPFALFAVLTDPGGNFSVSGTAPSDPSLAAAPILMQATDGGLLTEPELLLLRP